MIVSPLNLILARAHLEHPPKDLVGLLIALELEGESEPLWSELAQLRQVNEDGRILASTLAAGAWREYFAWTVGISSDIGKGFPPPILIPTVEMPSLLPPHYAISAHVSAPL